MKSRPEPGGYRSQVMAKPNLPLLFGQVELQVLPFALPLLARAILSSSAAMKSVISCCSSTAVAKTESQ